MVNIPFCIILFEFYIINCQLINLSFFGYLIVKHVTFIPKCMTDVIIYELFYDEQIAGMFHLLF